MTGRALCLRNKEQNSAGMIHDVLSPLYSDIKSGGRAATFLVCHVGAASPCGDSCLRIADLPSPAGAGFAEAGQGFGSYKYLMFMQL